MASQTKCPFAKGIESIANSQGGINKAMHSAIDSVNISDKDIQKGIDQMNQNYAKLKSKYGWMRDSKGSTKFLWNVYYFITGLLAVLLLFIPLLLFIGIFIILLYLLPIWFIEGRKVSFTDNVRLFLGKQRLILLTYKESDQGIIWHIRDRIIGTAQSLEFLIFASKFPVQAAKHEQIYAKLFGNDGEIGKAYPYLFSLGITDYDTIKTQLLYPNRTRKGNFVGLRQTMNNDAKSYGHAHTYDQLDFEHAFSKKIAVIINEILPQFYDFNKVSLPDDYMKDTGYWKNVESVSKNVPSIMFTTLYYLWFGKVLTKEECEGVGKTKSSAGYVTLPPFIHTLFANDYLLRKSNEAIEFHKKLIIKYGGDKLKRIYEYCDQYKIDRDIGVQSAAMTILFAGGQGSIEANIIERYKNNPEQEKKLYKANPLKYVYETIRYQTPVPTVSDAKWIEQKYTILGKEYVFPIGTQTTCSLVSANNDKMHFPNKPKEFDPSRDNDYGDAVSFNCIEKYYQKENWDKLKAAPRFCPGHDVAFLMLKTIIEKLHTLN